MSAVLEDYTTAPISDAERALFALIAKVVEDSTSITAEDLARAREAGWSDEALYDAITVCARMHRLCTTEEPVGQVDAGST